MVRVYPPLPSRFRRGEPFTDASVSRKWLARTPPLCASSTTTALDAPLGMPPPDACAMTSQPTLFLSREAERLGSSRQLRKFHDRGALVRLATGVFTPVAEWQALTLDEKYLARVRAASLISRPDAQFSHDSAAAVWRLPSIGPWSRDVHELTDRAPGGTSRVGIRRHSLGRDPHPTVVDDVTVTSLARTLVDVSCAGPFAPLQWSTAACVAMTTALER